MAALQEIPFGEEIPCLIGRHTPRTQLRRKAMTEMAVIPTSLHPRWIEAASNNSVLLSRSWTKSRSRTGPKSPTIWRPLAQLRAGSISGQGPSLTANLIQCQRFLSWCLSKAHAQDTKRDFVLPLQDETLSRPNFFDSLNSAWSRY